MLYIKDNGNNITYISGLNNNPVIPGTEGMVVPIGTTAQRPTSPTNGTLRYNSTTNKFEGYQNNVWTDIVGDSGTPGGLNTQIQFNDNGTFGGDVDFTWNKTFNELAINAGRMVIGSSAGSSNVRLRLIGDMTYNTPISIESFGINSLLNMQRANGTSGTPTAVVNNEIVASLNSAGYDGSTYQQTSDIIFQVSGSVSSGNVPTAIVFRTSPSNTASKVERLRIAPSGAIGLSGANYGTAGQVLTSQGSGSPLTWQTLSIPYNLGVSIQGIPSSGSIVFTYVAPRAFTIAANFVNSQAKAATAATAAATFTIRKNGTSIGTVTFAAGATTGTFSGAAGSFTVGDVLTITAPNPADATLADIGITLAGTA